MFRSLLNDRPGRSAPESNVLDTTGVSDDVLSCYDQALSIKLNQCSSTNAGVGMKSDAYCVGGYSLDKGDALLGVDGRIVCQFQRPFGGWFSFAITILTEAAPAFLPLESWGSRMSC
jgi:hypothetical protein